MQNKIRCQECGKFNPVYALKCKNCGNFLRGKVVNIDLWKSLWTLFYAPTEAFEKIILAEHKNFTIIFSFLIPVKLFFDFIFGLNTLKINLQGKISFPEALIASIAIFIIMSFLFSILLKLIGRLLKLNFRIRDFYSIIIFSFANLLILLFILSPIEYALFGKYWFTFEVSPFFLRPAAAYVLSAVELIFLLFSFVNLIIGLTVYLNSRIAGAITAIIYNANLIYLISILLSSGILK